MRVHSTLDRSGILFTKDDEPPSYPDLENDLGGLAVVAHGGYGGEGATLVYRTARPDLWHKLIDNLTVEELRAIGNMFHARATVIEYGLELKY